MHTEHALDCVNLVPIFKSLPLDEKKGGSRLGCSTPISQGNDYLPCW